MRTDAVVGFLVLAAVVTTGAFGAVDDLTGSAGSGAGRWEDGRSRAADATAAPELPTGGAAPEGRLPPDDLEALTERYGGTLEQAGLRLTRAGLADGPGSQRDPSLRGRHLALYVEPLDGTHGARAYRESFVASARVFLPSVFRRWPGLASMDVCQEPPPGADRPGAGGEPDVGGDVAEDPPPPVTILEVTRAGARGIDWGSADLAAIRERSEHDGVRVFLHEDVVEGPL